jgi:hypothetical protein
VEEIVAVEELLLPQTPPGTEAVIKMDAVWHTVDGPLIVPGAGSGLMVMVFVVKSVPQILLTV